MTSAVDEILIVDDEPSVAEVVSLYLKREGYEVRTARDGREALMAIQHQRPALVILDLMLPGLDGLEVVRRLRQDIGLDLPIIMLTARRQETDRIYGLELGADDYVTKPFSPAEVVARVKAVLRRTRGATTSEAAARPLRFGELLIDPLRRQVMVGGREVELTATEFNLLAFMARHPQQVFSRSQLLENVWGFSDFVDSSTVTVHIRRLREKLEVDPGRPRWLLTVWGVGYKFNEDDTV